MTSVHIDAMRSLAVGLILTLAATVPAPALTITEIMYFPAGEDSRRHEYIEIFNENPDPLDLSGFTICDGVAFEFPRGTWLDGYAFLVVCADETAIQAKYGIENTIGDWPWEGDTGVSLSNGGEDIEICNPGGISLLRVDYNDRGKWPVGADGVGHSLELIAPYTEQNDPDSWMLSDEPGGSPGVANPCWPEKSAAGGGGGPGGGPVGEFHEHGDVGAPCGIGNTVYNEGSDRYTISGGGNDIWAGGDQFQFAYVRMRGNFDIRGRIVTRAWFGDQRWGKGGLMCRQDLSVSSRYVFVHDNPSPDGARLARRTDHGGNNNQEPWNAGDDQHPNWYRLNRSGNTIRGYWSNNGTSWTQFGGSGGTTAWAGGEDVYLGLALTSHNGCGTSALTWGDLTMTGTRISSPDGGGDDDDDDDDDDPVGGDDGVCDPRIPVLINEGFFRTAGDRWIELHNPGPTAISLAEHFLTDDKNDRMKAQLDAGAMIPPGGFLSFTDVELGLDFSVTPEFNEVFVALTEPDGTRVVNAVNFRPSHDELSEARVPDGGEMRDAADPTRDAANRLVVVTEVVINEVMYHPIDNDDDKEFVELFNRGGSSVDLTDWSFTSGVRFDFPPGTTMGPGEYLVIARNDELIRSIYGLSASECIGPIDKDAIDRFGVLSDRGERVTLQDGLGRTADTVRLHDGGEWPRWADGHGSSVELIDPFADNRIGMAWDASDDSDEAPVAQFSYSARHGGEDSELHLLLLSRGITVVDNVSVRQGGVSTVDVPLVDDDEIWRFFRGDEAAPEMWTDVDFDDGDWESGQTGIGYGDGDDATVLDDMRDSYLTVFCRKSFTLTAAQIADVDELVLSVIVDDGFNAYLNGEPVTTFNTSGPNFDDGAITAGEPNLQEQELSIDALRVGTNVLAVSVHNAGTGSSDLSFIPRLVSRTIDTEGGGIEKLNNPTFNSSTTGWAIEGTHVRSGRTTVHAIDGAGSLKIIASGRGDNKVNRIESTNSGTQSFPTGEDLLVSFDAQWHVGSRTLNTHGYKHAMAKTHELTVPDTLGTPGAVNSVTQRRIDGQGDSNLGPTITDLEQDPAVPIGDEDVTIRCRVADADGIAFVRLRYSVNNPSSSLSTVAMSRVVTLDNGGVYEGVVPGRGADDKIVFFIESRDDAGHDARFPIDVAERSHPMVLNGSAGLNDRRYFIYRHDPTRASTSPFHDYRFYMTEADEAELSNRKRLSNDLIYGTFTFGGCEVYHESGTRFSGSPWARGQWNGSFRVVSPRDKPIHGWIRKFNLEDHHGNGGDARERTAHYLLRYNQGCGFVPYSEVQTMAQYRVNDRVNHVREHVWVPDTQYVGLWFGDGDGDFVEMDDRFVINDNGDRSGSANGRLLYPPPSERGDGNGANKENYRWFFGLRAKNGSDDFTRFQELCRLLDPGDTSTSAFARRVWDEVNIDEFMRTWAVRHSIGDWDNWSADRGKNTYFYHDPSTGLWNTLSWDLELTFEGGRVSSFLIPSSPTSDFNPGSFSEVHRFFDVVAIKKYYYGILDHMVNNRGAHRAFFTSAHLGGYMDRLSDLGMSNTGIGQPGGYVDQRRDLIRSRLGNTATTSFRITTNSGNDDTTAAFSIDIAGAGPARICQILVNGEDLGVVHNSMTGWRVEDIPLHGGPNFLEFISINLKGDIEGTDSITITNTSELEAPVLVRLEPASAEAGTEIDVIGDNFIAGARVFFGAVEADSVTLRNVNRLTVRVPDGAGTVDVKVRNVDDQESDTRPFTYVAPAPEYVRGDVNGDGRIDISDPTLIILHLFGGVGIDCQDAADADDDEAVTITDAIHLLDYTYRGGGAPPAPFPTAGPDPAGDSLGCDR